MVFLTERIGNAEAGSHDYGILPMVTHIEAKNGKMIRTGRKLKLRATYFKMAGLTAATIGFAIICLSFVSLTSTPAQAATPKCPADKFIAEIGKDLFSAAKSGSQKSFKSVVVRYADTPQIGRFALGRYRKALAKDDASSYYGLVADYVARLMADNAVQFQGNRFEITRCPQKNKLVAVTSKLHSELHGVRRVVWRLVKRDTGFRVLDVNVHGVWLGVQLRSKFTSVIKKNKGDINRLYAYLAPEKKTLQPVGGQ